MSRPAFARSPFVNSTLDEALAHALDSIGQGIALFDESGTLIYRNAWLSRAQRLPSGEVLAAQLREFVHELVQMSRFRVSGDRVMKLAVRELPPAARPARRFTGSYLGDHFGAQGTTFLVTIDTAAHVPYTLDQLRERFPLTMAEARIAFYIAQDLGTMEIAQVLGISPHTVRRHVERVLRKLGAESRSAVARLLTHTESSEQ